MGLKISVCGKGGSGKSTVAVILAYSAINCGLRPLVVDSDESNSALFRLLGLDNPPLALLDMVGGKQALKGKMGQPSVLAAPRISIDQLPPAYCRQANGLSLVTIGKIHQALEGCACPMGVLSREFLTKLELNQNELAIVDMEAGIEHLGRGIDCGLDYLVLVVDPSYESILLAEKIKAIAESVKIDMGTVLNKVGSPPVAEKLIFRLRQLDLHIVGTIPHDSTIFEAGLAGEPFGKNLPLDYGEDILKRILENQRWNIGEADVP